MTNTYVPDLRSNLPGVYDVGKKVRDLLAGWRVPAQTLRAPDRVIQGLDYGYDQDAFACAVSFNRAAGREVSQDIFSVVPFDSNGLGSWAAKESIDRFGDGSDGQQRGAGTLFVLNSAPGRNVPGGTKDNVRERFFGAKLRNGAVVVATHSDQLWEYLADQTETIVDLDLWKSGSQARGVDVFQTLGYAFYQEASQPGWQGGVHEHVIVKPRAIETQPTPLVMALPGTRHKDGVPRYLLTNSSSSIERSDFQVVPVPADPRSAGYTAFRLANGSQCRRNLDDPKNVPAIYVIADGFDQWTSTPQEVWAQVQNDGSLVVGPDVGEYWAFSPADQPVIALDQRFTANQIHSVAEQLFGRRKHLQLLGQEVGDFRVALPYGPVAGRIDYFGNWDVHNADPRVGQTIDLKVGDDKTRWPVRERMFDAETATLSNPQNPNARGFSCQASGGGWKVRAFGPHGEVLIRPLQTSQAYVRTDSPALPSAAFVVGANRIETPQGAGPFEVPIEVKVHEPQRGTDQVLVLSP